MCKTLRQGILIVVLSAIAVLAVSTGANAQVTTCTNLPGETCKSGSLNDGAKYLIEVPSNWNGVLFLYSHGYVPPVPGAMNPAMDVGDPVTGTDLLGRGYALAGSSYAHTGWAIQEALVDQIQVLDIFDAEFGKPQQTIACGLVINENESAYRTIVDLTGNHKFLRQTFVSRAGHCTFTPAETIAAVNTLLARVETGHWSAVDANTLNGDATALGPNFNIFPAGDTIVPTPPAFVEFLPGPYPRPFDSLAALCPKGANHGCPFAFFLQH